MTDAGAHYRKYQKPWRGRNPDLRRKYRKRNYDLGDFSIEPRREWTRAEDRLVLAHDRPDRELARELRRSVRAVQVRRCRLKSADEA